MAKSTFLIVGGTGTVGTPLAEELAKLGAIARVATRDPGKVDAGNGREAVRFDLTDPATFEPALRDVQGVFVLSPPGHARQDELLRPFLEVAAKRAPKIVTMTANGVQYDDTNPMRRIELQVAGSGVRYVHLRPGWFMQNFNTFWLLTIQSDGVIALPAADSKTAFIDARDIGAVAAHALTGSSLDGQALTLTGPEALTYAQAAEVLSSASGRTIGYVSIDDERFRQGLLGAGLPTDYAGMMVGLFGFVRQGAASQVDDSVAKVLGRARTLRDYARDYAQAWAR